MIEIQGLKEYEIDLNLKKLKDSINTLNNGFGFIAKKNDLILACVDRIRSYPIFYLEKKNIKISGDIHCFIDKNLELETDLKKIIEFAMTGYLTNDKTFLSDVKQLESAEVLQYPNLKITCVRFSKQATLNDSPQKKSAFGVLSY